MSFWGCQNDQFSYLGMELCPEKRFPIKRSRRTRHPIDLKKCDPSGTRWPSIWVAIIPVMQQRIKWIISTITCDDYRLDLHLLFSCSRNFSFVWPVRNRQLWLFRDQLEGHCGPLNRRAEPVKGRVRNKLLLAFLKLADGTRLPFCWPKIPSHGKFVTTRKLNRSF